MNFFKSKPFIALTCTLLGACITLFGVRFYDDHKIKSEKREIEENLEAKNKVPKYNRLFDDFFDEDFFSHSQNPFQRMDKMRKNLDDFFHEDTDHGFNSKFDDWFKGKFGGNIQEIKEREDDDFVYWEINANTDENSKVDVKVEGDTVTISGQTKTQKKSEDGGNYGSVESYSNFTRSFPAPPDTDPSKLKMEQKDGKIIVKLPKTKK